MITRWRPTSAPLCGLAEANDLLDFGRDESLEGTCIKHRAPVPGFWGCPPASSCHPIENPRNAADNLLPEIYELLQVNGMQSLATRMQTDELQHIRLQLKRWGLD